MTPSTPGSSTALRFDPAGSASGRHPRPDPAGPASGRHPRPDPAGSASGRHPRPAPVGLKLDRPCPEAPAATPAEQSARDAAWRRAVGAAAQLGPVAGAIDVELRTSGAPRGLRLFDAARDPAGLPAALRALDGLRGEVQRVHVTLRSSRLRVVAFDRAEPLVERAAA